jgi:3D (Asp-Asp-Asp) domain-containing protein
MRNGDRARQLVARLNDVFGSPRADLDFITPGIGSDPFASNQYAVIWSQVTWYPDCSQYTDTNDGRTYELVYTGYNDKSKVTTLITITAADVDLYGKPRWRIALDWANIFHTNDLTVAVRSDLSFLDDKWVRISYGGKSVVARATDRAGQHTQIDLSAGGVAHYLGFPGSGTVSYGPP